MITLKISYNKFLNEEIKSITKGKTSRTDEGLLCHHINENIVLNISSQKAVKILQIPYKHQLKDRLVYCYLIEHAILHALTVKETNGQFGLTGLELFIAPNIKGWYVNCIIPTQEWKLNCYKKSYLSVDDALEMSEVISNIY